MGDSKLIKLRDKFKEELVGMYKEGPLESAKVPMIKDLAKSVYYLTKICEECEKEEGYSQARNSYNSYNNQNGNSNYSGNNYSGNRYPMSYDDGRKNMIHRIGDLMMCTTDERTQSILRNALEQLERM